MKSHAFMCIQEYLIGNRPFPTITTHNLNDCQDAVSFLAEICSVLNDDAKDKLIRLQEAVYEATVRHYESQQMVVVESES